MQFHMIPGGPTPVAPFSHAVETDGLIFVTGQMPDTPAAPGVLPHGIVAQTRRRDGEPAARCWAGSASASSTSPWPASTSPASRRTIAALNETWRSYFAEGRLPARTCVGVTGLAYDALVEIDLVVRRPASA